MFKRVWQVFLLCFSFIFPKNKRIIIYGAWYGKNFSDNSKYLFLSSQNDSGYKHIWITKNKGVFLKMNQCGYRCYYYLSFKGIYYQLRAKKAVVCVGFYDMKMELLSGKIIIQVWHGIPLKKIGFDVSKPGFHQRFRDRFFKRTFIVCPSETYRAIYKSAFGVDERHLIMNGQPRNDVFFDAELLDSKMRSDFSKEFSGKRVILYMPTHRQEGKEAMNIDSHLDLNKINRLCRDNDAFFIIKKHFYHSSESIISGYSNVVELSGDKYDSQFLLAMADLLVTDYSSCYIDYMLRNKPIIFYQYDLDVYKKNDRELYFDSSNLMPGPIVLNFDDFYEKLKELLSIHAFEPDYKTVKDFYYNPDNQGVVSKRLLEQIKEL